MEFKLDGISGMTTLDKEGYDDRFDTDDVTGETKKAVQINNDHWLPKAHIKIDHDGFIWVADWLSLKI